MTTLNSSVRTAANATALPESVEFVAAQPAARRSPTTTKQLEIQEIVGTFQREKCRRDDWVLGEAALRDGQRIAIQGVCPEEDGPLAAQCEYRFYGRYQTHPQYGTSFKFETFTRATPYTRSGTVRYLQDECKGIGQAIASAVWDAFGPDSVRILRDHPEIVVSRVNGLKLPVAQAASKVLSDLATLEGVTIDMLDLLGSRGFPKRVARQVTRRWGNRAAELIRRNPYRLLAFRGCGFSRCDQLYLELGLNPASIKRQALCIVDAVARDRDGHTWITESAAIAALKKKIGSATPDPRKALEFCRRAKLLAFRDRDGVAYVAEFAKAEQESHLAELLAVASIEKFDWPALGSEGESLDEHQREHAAKAMADNSAVGHLGGSPGTGKTYTAARIIRAAIKKFGAEKVGICAPTNKAAVRLSDTMQRYGVGLRCLSIHSLLRVAEVSDGGWSFVHNSANPLELKLIVVDEASMIATPLMRSLLDARPQGCGLLLIGDTNQLPPIEHGAPLRDIKAPEASIPWGELTDIKRNSGTIVRSCASIRDRKPWVCDETLDPDNGHNLKLLHASSGAQALERIVECLRRLHQGGLADPIRDCQVVVAVNTTGSLSRRLVNQRLQAEFNPTGHGHPRSPFRVGDKVICLSNGFVPIDPSRASSVAELIQGSGPGRGAAGQAFVANGEQGIVLEAQERFTCIELSSPRRIVKIPRGASKSPMAGAGNSSGGSANGNGNGNGDEQKTDTGCDWDLAYAISCHKSQGSSFKVVIVALDESAAGPFGVGSRHWLYTAISRAEHVCFLVGTMTTAKKLCEKDALSGRVTFLPTLIAEQREKMLRHSRQMRAKERV